MKKVSIRDVAEKAGVSTALVSYVLNNRMQGRISKETAARIKKAARELNYQPNSVAQSLKLQKTRTIGLIVADIANPFSAQLARIIEDEAQQKGYIVIIGSSDENAKKSARLIELFLNRQVDGFIIAAVEHAERQIRQLVSRNIPVVLIDRYFPSLKTNTVTIDNYQASCRVTQHLVDTGRKRIAVVAYKTDLFHLQERVRGYKDTLRKNKLPAPAMLTGLVRVEQIDKDVAKALNQFLSSKVKADAVYFTSNKLAIAGLKVLMNKGIDIPDKLALVSFDESEAFDLFHAPLTYVKQPLDAIGKGAVDLVISNIEHHNGKISNEVLDTELVIRRSSAGHQ